ncbi:hypothetical protein A6R71_10095 [Xanthomonas translucens pv. arrhenatheri]|jgi:hypothetical protein|uniref:Uncharacterized protein n=2 Tax=Xanthomonas graminis TaxID=3390026 RepID=A0A0K2ZEW1_9XANT|nr:DUF6491 family protein [Xanthomonas translucens]EKU25565.1 hypothetical protein XTG29_01440 [Xanthomonas translucens pv. graminis ART-Xtg29]OAX59639.1 hypothetical protein A6R72_16265 [Xanthomonas translucens pv. graminis]OAX64856.1 hypothetical protein A6R71_10095 [Xanthomonas translucens pv. arrhenatheri]UKE55480.1 hypothetical protein KFS84_06940 [Xanthomonas translucens pv. graminis]UKE76252.1 DUF6491 family protein [Xanthomonas translucens pv. arrhenatheri]
MKRLLLSSLGLAALLVGCASNRISDDERLALYRAHAAAPVRDFQYFNRLSGWTALGDSALAVWTRPNQAYLLELNGRCTDLDFAPSIAITHFSDRVSARFDVVLVIGGSPGAIRLPCRIQSIRPLDIKALRSSEQELREAKVQERAQRQAPAQ